MKIAISEIKVSQNPIRTEQDEEKLNELVQSIKEQGLIVPIKVRPNGNGYEVVYGHRRLEACKRAGLAEIEAWVEGVDDTDQLIQALIENVVRENMSDLDEGIAYKTLKDEYGLSTIMVANKVGKSPQWINRCVALVNDPLSSEFRHLDADIANIAEITRGIEDIDSRRGILAKVKNESLSRNQTAKVAEAIAQAQTPEEKQALLDTKYENPNWQSWAKSVSRAHQERERDKEERHLERTQQVKDYLSAIFTYQKAIDDAVEATEFDKFSPESARFCINKHIKVREALDKFDSILREIGNV